MEAPPAALNMGGDPPRVSHRVIENVSVPPSFLTLPRGRELSRDPAALGPATPFRDAFQQIDAMLGALAAIVQGVHEKDRTGVSVQL